MDPSMNDPSYFDNIPALTPPPGVTPNFIDPPSLAPVGRIIIGITLLLTVISVVSRLYTRLHITHSFGTDDVLCIVSAIGVISYAGVTLSSFGPSLGPHQWNVRLSAITPAYVRGSIVLFCLYSATVLFIKTSLLVLYLRIFKPARIARILIWIGILLITLFYLACIVISAIFCNPAQWSGHIGPVEFLELQARSNCNRPQLDLSAAQGIFSTVSDAYILVIPTILVSGLRLPLRRRIGICAIFLIGAIALGSSIATVVFRFQQRKSADFSWESALNIILGAVEINTGLICSCIPVSFVAFKRLKSVPWASIKDYLNLRHFKHTGEASTNAADVSKPAHKEKLPQIPRGIITGLKTFIQGGQDGSPTELNEFSSYAELRSIDEDYHKQLKAFHTAESTASQAWSADRPSMVHGPPGTPSGTV
ncbi:hypothetical protein F4801DRAFT_532071 [Xylaria longipes]|nr:hypothetical protein F4801DRAFT_532071 [Xylaria longipes]